MSKMDNLRAMREAKYDAMAKRTAGPSKAAPARATPARPPVAPPSPTDDAEPSTARPTEPGPTSAPATCGHRNMSGRTCTREAGHAAKSHRYS